SITIKSWPHIRIPVLLVVLVWRRRRRRIYQARRMIIGTSSVMEETQLTTACMVPLYNGVDSETLAMYVPKKVKKVYDLYSAVVDGSEGFDCDANLYKKLPKYIKKGNNQPVDVVEHADSLEKCSLLAIGKHNSEKKTNLKFESIIKANMVDETGGMLLDIDYYITLKAKNMSIEPPEVKTYKAKVAFMPFMKKRQYHLYRFLGPIDDAEDTSVA
ncbi:hypothetical protein Tsubulata_020260, partial [Turnera subulata]